MIYDCTYILPANLLPMKNVGIDLPNEVHVLASMHCKVVKNMIQAACCVNHSTKWPRLSNLEQGIAPALTCVLPNSQNLCSENYASLFQVNIL